MGRPAVILLGLFLLSAATGRAEEPSGTPPPAVPPSAEPDSALTRALARVEGDPLTLDRAFDLGFVHATDLREAQAQVDAAQGAVRREKGAFWPEVFGVLQKQSDDTPSASPFTGAAILKTRATDSSVGTRLRTMLGTDLQLSLDTRKLNSNSIFASLNPQHDATGRLSIRQPLLKGFGPSAKSELDAAHRELEAAEARRDDMQNVVRAEIEMTYWNLYAAERDLAVQWLIVEQSGVFLDETRRRSEAGLVGPGDPANARVFLAEQEQALLDRREQVDAISDQLASLMGTRPAGGLPRFRTTSDPPRIEAPASADSLVARSFEHSPELRAVKGDLEAAKVRARGARWDAWPALDVFGTFGGYGLAGTGQDVVFGEDTLRTTVSGGSGDAIGDVWNRDFPFWSAGVRLSVPLGGSDRGERDRLDAEVRRAEEQVAATQHSLEERVRAAARELGNSEERLESARGGMEASLEQLRIGRIENRNGRSTAFELVRLGADLADAQRRYSEALVRSAKASAELRQLTGGS